MPLDVESFLTANEEQDIVDAIKLAEKNTSGEIRVHIENTSKNHVEERALEVFSVLKMHNTKNRNGVLIYVAVDDHKFSIYGDEAVMEMYLAISVTQFFPTFKRGIGYSETCSNVQLDI